MFNGILSQQNKEKFSNDGIHLMDKPSADGEKIFWRCDKRRQQNATEHTAADDERSFLKMVTAHSVLNYLNRFSIISTYKSLSFNKFL